MRLFDSHCHLCDMKSFSITDELAAITSGYSHESNLKNSEIVKSDKTGRIHCIMGIAPQTAQREENLESELAKWAEFIRTSPVRPLAIGEIGLDNHWGKTKEDKIRQQYCFEKMIELARELHFPIVIHSRDAETEILDFLAAHHWSGRGDERFIMHCFSGTLEEAQRAVDLGGIISIPPIRSKDRKKIARDIPLGKLIVETDAPYIGKTLNDINLSVQIIADAKGMQPPLVADATYKNAASFFGVRGD